MGLYVIRGASVLGFCGVLAFAPAPAAAKPGRADLAITAITSAGAPVAGAKLDLRVTVRNTGKVTAARSQLSVGFEKAALGRANVAKLKPGRRRTVALRVSVPKPSAPGRYRITACADAAKKVKERSETNNCRSLSRALDVVASAPAPVVLPAPPAPPGAPAATPAATAIATPTSTPAGEVPPEDLPPLIPSIVDTAERLYAGQGVTSGAIADQRAGILRGRTLQRNGSPLKDVRVRVHDHPELGSTTTAADGSFELAVNGGAQITLEYTRTGYLEVQRDLDPTQHEWTTPPDVVLLDADSAGVIVNPPTAPGWTTARATAQIDPDGTRTSTLLFAPGTTATMRFANGTTRPLPGPWTVRQTEYTSVGPDAMPADLPATSGYTYAAELAIDEADTAGADSVELTAASPAAHAAVNYVENFIGAPVGSDVPTGSYNRTDAVWEPSPDGRIVKLLTASGDLDTNGDGQSTPADYPPSLKLTAEERTALAALYPPGTELLRVPIPHLSPWDHNWPYGYPQGARRPRLGPDGRPLPDGCSQPGSSTIGCEDQKLGESVDVAGTPYRLAYSSDWEPGAGNRALDVTVTEPTLPNGLLAVELVVQIAGQTIIRRYADPAAIPDSGLPPITPDAVAHVAWDGLDGQGQPVIGSVPAHLTLNYYYRATYYASAGDFEASFAQIAAGATDNPFPARGCSGFTGGGPGGLCAFKLSTEETRTLNSVGRLQVGLGGWDLDAHHVYDALAGEVRLGDGTIRRGGDVELGRLRTVAGPGAPSYDGAGIGTGVLGVLPDGSVLHGGGNVIRRVTATGADTPFAGNGSNAFAGACNGGPALQRSLSFLTSMAVRPTGAVVVALANNALDPAAGNRICEVTPDGKLVLLGGADLAPCPSGDCRGDGGLARNAPLQRPDKLTLAPDGSVYFVEDPGPTNANRKLVRRIDPAGIISTVAGGGNPNSVSTDPDGKPATGYKVDEVSALVAMADGTLLLAETENGVVTEVGTDGILHRYAGTFGVVGSGYRLDVDRRTAFLGRVYGLAAGRDGSVYATVETTAPGTNNLRRRILRIRPDGVVVRALGFGAQTPCPQVPTELESAVDRCGLALTDLLTVDGDGMLLFADGTPARVRRLEPTLGPATAGTRGIASADGRELWFFDASGRHLRTVDGLTGALELEFGYDAAGQLVRAEDADHRKTLIERDAAGAATAIVAPDGRRTPLAVNAAGRLSAITDPTGAVRGFTYDGGGRLNHQALPSGRTSSYVYDSAGRLGKATGAAGQTRTLARTETATGAIVSVTSGAGLLTRFSSEQTAGGGMHRTVTTPSGAVTDLLIEPNGTRTLTLPSGETRRTTTTFDRRLGGAVSRVRQRTVTTPSGKSLTLDYAYGATLTAGDPFNPAQLTATVTSSFGTTNYTYDGPTRTATTVSPGGRRQATTFDARGRPVKLQVGATGALAPGTIEYGPTGAISRLVQGTQITSYERDAAGRVTAIVAADGQRLEYAYDAADRLTERRYPGGRTYRYARDPDGELTARRLPSLRADTFAPTGIGGQTAAWTPPGGAGSYTVSADDDKLATAVTSPTGAVSPVISDAAGRVTSVSGRTVTYAPGSDRVARYESKLAPGDAVQTLTPAFDGMRVTKLTAAGLSPAETTWTYDAKLSATSVRMVSGADDATLAYARDADGVLTGVGPFSYERNGPDKSLSAITDGSGRTEETVDAVADLKTRVLKVGGNDRYRLELTTDATGRVTARREIAGAGDHVYAYAYDAIGELIEVRRDGALVEAYAYDLDGDRISQGATYDAGGKLTSRGGTSYTFDADGFLTARGADTFAYARSGELRSATVGAKTLAYAYDALGRMVARIDGADTTRFIYADPNSPYRLSAARAPDGTLNRYLYGPRGNLYAILRGAARFHVAADQVGSPRVVVDASGAVVKRLEYDAYGVSTDLDPGFFLPVGYAGGISDPVTGLVRFGLRDYEPRSGRFVARDPAMLVGSPRSIFGYANNSPLSYRDPGGTASLSISGYEGVGGGVSLYFDPSAIFDRSKPLIKGVCFELGVGVGGGVEGDPEEQANPDGGISAIAELGAKVPFLGAKVGGEFDLICGTGKGKLGGNLGPYQRAIDSDGVPSNSGGLDPSAGSLSELAAGVTNMKIEGKLALKACLPEPPS